MNMKEQVKQFEQIWWEMESIEPLTPLTSRNETNEISPGVRSTQEERLRS